tara:strand:+ start:42 stop:938 length:897 start_codon:yes stop_codon:yes gene_type:complete
MRAIAHNNNKFNLTEPFDGLFTQGMVCHETYKDSENNWVSPEEIETIDGKKYLKKDRSKLIKVGPSESMSKSKKNTIDPENIISNYGADAARLFILSDSPPEKDVQWSEEGIVSSFKFVQKLWILNSKILEEIKKDHQKDHDDEISKFTNRLIKKITENLENFSYNKIVANLHEMHSFLLKKIEKKYTKKTLIENYQNILLLMSPVLPHFTSECFEIANIKGTTTWPKYNENLIQEDEINIVVQINGKKRGLIKSKRDIKEIELFDKILTENSMRKYIKDKKIRKKIFVPNKLINILI